MCSRIVSAAVNHGRSDLSHRLNNTGIFGCRNIHSPVGACSSTGHGERVALAGETGNTYRSPFPVVNRPQGTNFLDDQARVVFFAATLRSVPEKPAKRNTKKRNRASLATLFFVSPKIASTMFLNCADSRKLRLNAA